MDYVRNDKIEQTTPDGGRVVFFGCHGPAEEPTETYAAAIAYPAGAAPMATNFWQTIQIQLTPGFDERRVLAILYAADVALANDLA